MKLIHCLKIGNWKTCPVVSFALLLGLKIILFFVILIFDFSFLISNVSASTIIKTPSSLGLSSGLVGYWTFDGKDLTDKIYDRSPVGTNHGYFLGGATSSAKTIGKLGQGLSFDGVDDYINIGATPSLNLTNNYTITFWAKPNSFYISGNGVIRQSNSFGSNSDYRSKYDIRVYGSRISFITGNGTTGDSDNFTTTTRVGVWSFFACTLDSSNIKSCYKNGTLISTTTNDVDNSSFTPTVGVIGTLKNDGNFFPGSLDEIRVYNRTLSASEIQQLYKLGEATKISKVSSNKNNSSFSQNLGTLSISSNANDGEDRSCGAWETSYSGGGAVYMGYGGCGGTYDIGLRWTGVSIPQGATINSAVLSVYKTDITGTPTSNGWFGADEDNLAEWTDSIKPSTRTPTTANTGAWNPTSAGSVWEDFNVAPIIQEIVNRSGWVSGNAIGLFTKTTNTGGSNYIGIEDFNAGSTHRAKLTITYTTIGGLVGHWTFDGNKISGTSVLDSSGNGNTGTISGATKTIGKLGQALIFKNGNSLSLSSPALLDDIESQGGGGMTISAWVYPVNFNSSSVVVAKDGNSSGYWHLYISTYSNQAIVRWSKDFSSGDMDVFTQYNDIVAGKWQHVILTWDGSSDANNVHIYVNGVDETQSRTNGSGTKVSDAANNMYIGSNIYAQGNNTIIDDVRIYNRVLSASEIQQLYKLGEATKINKTPTNSLSSGLVGYWTFDGTKISGTSALDSSGNGNTGTITGATKTIGKLGQGLSFNSSSENKVTSSLGSITTYPFTLSVWVKTSSPASQTALSYASQASNVIFYGVGMSGGSAFIYCRASAPEEDWATGVTNTFANGQWVHLVGVFNSSTDKRIYVNGNQEALLSTSISFSQPDTVGVGYMARSAAFGYWNGSIDDARIYNRALTTTEIKQLYNMGK